MHQIAENLLNIPDYDPDVYLFNKDKPSAEEQ